MTLAIGYSLRNWTALTRFVDDGRIEAHNTTAERAPAGAQGAQGTEAALILFLGR